MFRKLIAAMVFSFMVSQSYAATNSGNVMISKIEVTDSFFTIYAAATPVVSDNCEDASKVVFWRTDYPNGYDSMLSVALAAHMANRKITMWLVGCKPGPWGKNLPKADSIVVLAN